MNRKRNVVLVFAFGAPKGIVSNKRLAMKAYLSSEILRAPIFTQRDVGVANKSNVIFVEDLIGKSYISSLDIIETFLKIARKKNWQRVWIIAAPQHQWRCLRDLKRVLAGGNIKMEIIPCSVACSVIFEKDWYDEKNWYDKNSVQWWTRSPLKWWLREIPLRLMPWWLYKKITK